MTIITTILDQLQQIAEQIGAEVDPDCMVSVCLGAPYCGATDAACSSCVRVRADDPRSIDQIRRQAAH